MEGAVGRVPDRVGGREGRVIVISSVTTPLGVVWWDTGSTGWMVAESTIDLVFLADIVVSFCSAYYNGKEELVSDRRRIAVGYLKTWFVIDVVSIFPVSVIARIAESQWPGVNQLAKVARMPRIYKIIKTSK